jgi:hypothetical protein
MWRIINVLTADAVWIERFLFPAVSAMVHFSYREIGAFKYEKILLQVVSQPGMKPSPLGTATVQRGAWLLFLPKQYKLARGERILP